MKRYNSKKKRSLIRPIIYLVVIATAALLFLLNPMGSGQGPSMKVVIDSNEMPSRFISESPDSYLVSVQDCYYIPKSEARLEIWSASKGQGVVYMTDYGKLDVKKKPSPEADTIGYIEYEEGYVPNTYKCLGYTSKGWYKIEVDASVGYVYKDGVSWDVIDSF